MPSWLERRLTGRTPRQAASSLAAADRYVPSGATARRPGRDAVDFRRGAFGMIRTLAYLSQRYWRRRPGRAVVSLSGIALGVGLMVAVVSVNQAVLRTYDGWAAAIAGRSQVEVRSVESSGMATAWLARVSALPGVRAAAPVVEQRSYLFTDSSQASVTLRGVDPVLEADFRPSHAVEGRTLGRDDRAVVVLSVAAAASLGVGVGDSVSLLTTDGVISLRVIGLEQPLEAVNLARDRTAVMALRDAQDSFMQGREVVTRIDVLASDPAVLGELRHGLADLFGGAATIRLPTDELRELATASRGLRFLLLLSGAMALVAASFLIATNLFAAVEERGRDLTVLRAMGVPGAGAATWLLIEAACLGLMGSVVGAVAGGGMAGGLLGRLPTVLLGGAATDALPGYPAALVVVLGAVAGVLVSVAAAWPLARRSWLTAVPVAPFEGRSGTAANQSGTRRARRVATTVGALVGVGAVGYLAGWLPPGGSLAAFGRSGTSTGGQLQALAVMVLVVALGWAAVRSFPLLLNRLGSGVRHLSAPPLWLRLATDSMRRHSRRSGATAISLMITLAGLVGVYGAADSYRSSLAAWLDASVSWDLLVSSGPPGAGPTTPLPVTTVAAVATVDGVLSALPERSVTVSSAGRAVPLVAFDAGVADPSRRLRVEAWAPGKRSESVAQALTSPGTVALSTSLAARLGVEAGERLPLSTHDGETGFLVVAVVEDPAEDSAGAAAAAAYVDLGGFAEAWRDSSVDQIGVRLDEGVDTNRAAAAVAAAVQRSLSRGSGSRAAVALDAGPVGSSAAAGPDTERAAHQGAGIPVQVVQAGAYREEVLDGVRDTFVVVRTLVLVAVLVALAGLLNAMLIGFWQLRHQLGLLRALGAPIRVLARTLAAEAALTTVAGGGAGVLLGTLLSLALLRGMDSSAGPLLVWSPPLQAYVVVATLLAVFALVASSLLDARARSTPVQAVVRGE